MIELAHLSKWYGPILALDAIDLNVPKGRIAGFLGPNGAGKTTTIRILTCFMPASDGRAAVNGFDVFKDSAQVRRSIGYLPESNPLYPEMRVDEHLHYFGKLHGLRRADRRARIGTLTERCGLSAIIQRPIGHLSKGNKQRVGLAQALLHDPPVLILDEPTAGLDPAQIREVRELICSLSREKTILLSTHILPEAEMTCDELTIIARGRVVAQGTPDQLKQRARASSRIVMEIQAPPAHVQQVLNELPQVARTDTDEADGWCVTHVTPADSADDIRPALGQAASQQRWIVREIRHEVGSLEEFFIQAVEPDFKQSA